MEHHMEVLLTAVVLIYSFGSSTGQDSYLDISTERKCANSQMILLSGDNFVIYFHYGYTSSVIDILQCLRGSETIFTFDQVDKEIITPNFIGRTNATFNETGLILSINAKTEGGNNDRATFSCSTDLTNAMTLAGSSSINSDPYEDVDESVVENQIKNLTFVIASLPADIIFYTETDPDDTLLDCQPATIISAIDVNGTVKCTGETQGTKCYCNFTMLEGSISTTENKICFNVSATLYSIDVHQLKCIPVDLATIMGEADDSITTEEPKVSSDGSVDIITPSPTINPPTTASGTTEEPTSVVKSTSAETLKTNSDEATATSADATNTSASTSMDSVETSGQTLLPDNLNSTLISASFEASSVYSGDGSSTLTVTSTGTPITPENSTTASESEKSTNLFYIAIPIGIIVMAAAIGVTCYAVNSSTAPTLQVSGASGYYAGDYYNGGYQDLLVQPPYGQYEYINTASMPYNPALRNGDLHQTRGSMSSRQQLCGKNMNYENYGRSVTPRAFYNPSDLNQMPGIPRSQIYWTTQRADSYVIM